MQDASIGSWAKESHLSIEHLNSMRDLNHRFLDLAEVRASDWAAAHGGSPGSPGLGQQVAPLSAAQRAAMASCPYALFDLRFADDAHWRSRLAGAAALRVADEPRIDDATLNFVQLALFYAWHVAANDVLGAHLLLGMHNATAAAFRRITVHCLPALAVTEAANLTARWSDCHAYWTALLGTATRNDQKALRRVQLSGLQLAAAAHMTVL
ncbi:MAG TPA: hypothetical protein VGH12_08035 [Steroidobacteraceae bacterium]